MTDVKELREAYCDHFIKTGELHQGMLAQLTAYALAINGPPKPDRRRAAGHFRKGKPRPVIMPSLRGRGRVKGSKMIVVDGVRKLVTPEQMERMQRETSSAQDKTDAPARR